MSDKSKYVIHPSLYPSVPHTRAEPPAGRSRLTTTMGSHRILCRSSCLATEHPPFSPITHSVDIWNLQCQCKEPVESTDMCRVQCWPETLEFDHSGCLGDLQISFIESSSMSQNKETRAVTNLIVGDPWGDSCQASASCRCRLGLPRPVRGQPRKKIDACIPTFSKHMIAYEMSDSYSSDKLGTGPR